MPSWISQFFSQFFSHLFSKPLPFKSYLKIYGLTILVGLIGIGLLNSLIDPLWYFQGNRLSGVNLPWNERVTKTNQLLKTSEQYDCILFGTSRSTLFDTQLLQNNQCFNYSFSGGKVEEYINYAQYLKSQQIEPATIYLEIELESFNRRKQTRVYPAVTSPMPVYQAYLLSANVLELSYRTLIQDFDFARWYDSQFRGRVAADAPTYEPELLDRHPERTCDPERIRLYQQLRQVFPNSRWVGFIAPISAWYLFNTSYLPDLLNCQLAGVTEVATLLDGLYDFAVPSALTSRTDNTYDGNHYYPRVYEQVAQVLEGLEGAESKFGVAVKPLSLADYQALYQRRLKAFLAKIGEADRFLATHSGSTSLATASSATASSATASLATPSHYPVQPPAFLAPSGSLAQTDAHTSASTG